MFEKNDRLAELIQRGYRYALSLCTNEAEAEDLAHDAWLRLAPSRGQRVEIGLYIRTIRNLYIDRYRRSRLVVVESYDDEPADTGWDRDILPHEMDAALESIRAEEREAIYLNVVEGYTAQKIADITDSARGSILSLIHRGKQKLALYLTDRPDRNEAGQ